jgi:hypothetical protein
VIDTLWTIHTIKIPPKELDTYICVLVGCVSGCEIVMALPSILSQIYSTMLLVAIIAINIWLAFGKVNFIYKELTLPYVVIDVLGTSAVATNCILDCLFRNFIYRHKVSLFRISLDETANFLHFTNHNNRRRTVKLLTHFTTFLTFGVNIYPNINYLDSTIYVIMGSFLMYRIFLLVLCVYDATNAIKDRLVLLSHKIEKLVQFSDTEIDNLDPKAVDTFKCYFVLVESMDNVGQIYGWQILVTYTTIVFWIVGTIYDGYKIFSMDLNIVIIVLGNILTTATLTVSFQ